MANHLGTLERVPIREIWKDEERDFTAWMSDQDNLDLLSEELGTALSLEETEKRVGPFEADLVASDGEGDVVVIENQFGRTDHDHLGKLLTYFRNLDAKAAVWISEDPRLEHEKVVEWLNEITPDDVGFYLVKVEVFRIGDSPPAPKFTAVVAPSTEAKVVGRKKKDFSEWHSELLEFWRQLLERAKEKKVLTHDNVNPRKSEWLSVRVGDERVWLTYAALRKDKTRVELVIDTRDKSFNKKLFDYLHNKRKEIEVAFGEELKWMRLDDRIRSRVRYTIRKGGVKGNERNWPVIQDAMVEAMGRLARAVTPHVEAFDKTTE
jgi:hypothetical protein